MFDFTLCVGQLALRRKKMDFSVCGAHITGRWGWRLCFSFCFLFDQKRQRQRRRSMLMFALNWCVWSAQLPTVPILPPLFTNYVSVFCYHKNEERFFYLHSNVCYQSSRKKKNTKKTFFICCQLITTKLSIPMLCRVNETTWIFYNISEKNGTTRSNHTNVKHMLRIIFPFEMPIEMIEREGSR